MRAGPDGGGIDGVVLSPVSVVALVLGIALLGTGALAWSGNHRIYAERQRP